MNSVGFTHTVDRRCSQSIKGDFVENGPGLSGDELLPIWTSDRDFPAPEIVLEALRERVDQGMFRSSQCYDNYYQAVIDWYAQRHNLLLQKEWFIITEGVRPGLAHLLQMLTTPGEGVIIQTPRYGFGQSIQLNGRRVFDNPLQLTDEKIYRMDLQQLEQLLIAERPGVILLCNPHNPAGRCWSKEELSELLKLCQRWSVAVIADEVWADILLPGNHFTSVLHLAQHYTIPIVAVTSASKAFGFTSLPVANFLIPDSVLRNRFKQRLVACGMDMLNIMSMVATTAAYQHGAGWLEKLLTYLAEGRNEFASVVNQFCPRLRLIPAEGTFLAWIDCRDVGRDEESLKQELVKKLSLIPSMGSQFGAESEGFIRLNLGCPRQMQEDAAYKLTHLGLDTD